MSTCVFEHCEQEGGKLTFDFSADNTGQRYRTRTHLCMDCYNALRAVKGNTGQLPKCDIEFTTDHISVDFLDPVNWATIQSMRFAEVSHGN